MGVILLVGLLASGTATGAVQGDGGGNGTAVCQFDHPEWRGAQFVAGVRIWPDPSCRPDSPAVVAAAVAGTNNVPRSVLMDSGLARDAVTKRNDRDGDGDPDEIHIRLEVAGLNEYNETDVTHAIAPGVEPAFWVFVPKTRGMVTDSSPAGRLMRMPSPPIRVEEGDRVRVTLSNTHYLPHTIHFHGVDHPYEVNGSGNDGVPQTSERPVLPGESRTYEFTPRVAGTMFYHCHVVPDVHVLMGLSGLFVVAENRSDNPVQTFNIGAGRVRHPSAAVEANYSAAYDLQYHAVDADLTRIPQRYDDVRRLARQLNRVYDPTEEQPDYYLLNGRSFPYTLRESLIVVEPGSRYRLRVLNSASETVSLHTHGHRFTIEAYDGVEVSERQEIRRDVVTISAAQRVDLTLNTTDDGHHAYGSGIWLLHDHREQAVTTDGISPGGDISMIVYESYLSENGIPQTNANLSQYFDADFYDGAVPLWRDLDAEHFGRPPRTGASGSRGHVHTRLGAQRAVSGPPAWFLLAVALSGVAFLAILGTIYWKRGDLT